MVGISLSLDAVLVAAGRPPGREVSGVASGGLVAPVPEDDIKISQLASGELLADRLTPLRSFFFLLNGEDHPWRPLLSSDPDRGLLGERKPPFQVFSCGIAAGALDSPTGSAASSERMTRLWQFFLSLIAKKRKR